MERGIIPDGQAQAPAHPRASCDFRDSSPGFMRFADFISPESAAIATHAEMTREWGQSISRNVALGRAIPGEPTFGKAPHPEPSGCNRRRHTATQSGSEPDRERARGRAGSRPPQGTSDPWPVGCETTSSLATSPPARGKGPRTDVAVVIRRRRGLSIG